MANRIADGNSCRPFIDGRPKETAQRLGLSPGRVLGDVENRQPAFSRKPHSISRVIDHLLDRPAFGVLADRTGPDEGGNLDWDADLLGDLHHRADIDLEGASGAERLDGQTLITNFFRQTGDIGDRARTGAGKTKVDRSDTELIG